MAVYPIAPGNPDYSSTGTIGFIPAIWSSKMIEIHYDNTCLAEIANTDYTGEIKAFGDSVEIRKDPTITVNNYVKGAKLTYETPESTKVTLQINKGKYFAFAVDSVDKAQMDINLIERSTLNANKGMKVAINTDVLGNIYSGVSSYNKGTTAGKKSGDINLGTTASALALTEANILKYIVDCGTVCDEINVPDEGRFMVIPAWVAGLIKKSDLKNASITGDGQSILRNGRLGEIDRFTLYMDNNVASVTDTVTCWHIPFGHKMGLTYASQIVEMETLKNPDTFGDLIRGLQVYGYKVVDATMLGDLYVKK